MYMFKTSWAAGASAESTSAPALPATSGTGSQFYVPRLFCGCSQLGDRQLTGASIEVFNGYIHCNFPRISEPKRFWGVLLQPTLMCQELEHSTSSTFEGLW